MSIFYSDSDLDFWAVVFMEISMDLEISCFKYEELDREIINSVVFEKSNKEIAEKTGYSIGTIKFRLGILFRQHGVKTKAGLVREVFQKKFF